MNVVMTRDWLLNIESQINKTILDMVEEANNNRTFVGTDLLKFTAPSMQTILNLTNSTPASLNKLPYIEKLFNNEKDGGHMATEVQIPNVSFDLPDGRELIVTLYLAWFTKRYRVEGIAITASQYAPVAEDCNYRLCIEAEEGWPDIAAYLTVWYINDLPKVNGVKQTAPKLMVGSRNYHKHSLNIGRGSDSQLSLHNLPGAKYALDVLNYYHVEDQSESEVELPFFEL